MRLPATPLNSVRLRHNTPQPALRQGCRITLALSSELLEEVERRRQSRRGKPACASGLHTKTLSSTPFAKPTGGIIGGWSAVYCGPSCQTPGLGCGRGLE